jgi:DNA-binding NarL/FixJ family response regulator
MNAAETRTRSALQNDEILVYADDKERSSHLEKLVHLSVKADFHIEKSTLKDGIHLAKERQPRMAILDIQDDRMDPLMFVKQIKQGAPEIRLIIIARDMNSALIQRALRAGASAYLTADEAETMLATALEQVLSGERFVSDDVMQGILHGMVESGPHEDRIPIELLSDREMVIFQMLGQGKPFREIALELNLNIKTVATHCNNIRRKLHSRDNRQLTRLSQHWVAERYPANE